VPMFCLMTLTTYHLHPSLRRMIMSHLSSLRNLFRCFIAAAAFMYGGANTVPAYASLVLTIDNYTHNKLAFTISGTFDTDTIGDNPGCFAVKNDWTASLGSHTELWTNDPSVVSISLTIDSIPVSVSDYSLSDTSWAYDDSFRVVNTAGINTPFAAGTAVSGSVLLAGSNFFNPVANNSVQLVSGYLLTHADWARLEANATFVPIPGAVWLLGSGLIGIVGIRRKIKQ